MFNGLTREGETVITWNVIHHEQKRGKIDLSIEYRSRIGLRFQRARDGNNFQAI